MTLPFPDTEEEAHIIRARQTMGGGGGALHNGPSPWYGTGLCSAAHRTAWMRATASGSALASTRSFPHHASGGEDAFGRLVLALVRPGGRL